MTQMRVAIAGLHHETNTFSPVAADLRSFDVAGVLRGRQIVSAFATSRHTIAGFLRACDEQGAVAVPLVYANLTPCGAITAEAFESVVGELSQALSELGPFDVVLLAQHGAAVSDDHPDVDGEIAARGRSLVGPDVTVAVGLDLHGNISHRLIEAVDLAVGYRENPHRDAQARGFECATLALRRARGEIRPVQRLVRLPMVVPILGGWTGAGAMRQVMSGAARTAAEHSLLSYTVFHGFGYADVPHMGSSVLAVADSSVETAARAARELADGLWQRRSGLEGEALSPSAAAAEARRLASDAGPVVLLDVGDNVGGGAPGDSTVLLAEAQASGMRRFVATLRDERAVRRAIAAGVGAEVELTLGATTPSSVGPELRMRGTVTRATDGRFEDPSPTHAGFRFHDGGPTVRLSTPEAELVISSRPVPSWSPEQLRAVGIEPREQLMIVAKGVVAPRAGYEAVASAFLLADTPGVTAADLSRLPYRRRPHPIWPLDPDATRTRRTPSRTAALHTTTGRR